MGNIVDTLKKKDDLLHGKGTDMQWIYDAEQALGTKFAKEYTEYLLAFGVAAYDGHEMTGASKSSRINVVDVTRKYRVDTDIFDDMYVVEETNYDGIIIWQSSSGEVYQSDIYKHVDKIYDSLSEYINN